MLQFISGPLSFMLHTTDYIRVRCFVPYFGDRSVKQFVIALAYTAYVFKTNHNTQRERAHSMLCWEGKRQINDSTPFIGP